MTRVKNVCQKAGQRNFQSQEGLKVEEKHTMNATHALPSLFAMEHPSAHEFSTLEELHFWDKGSILSTLCLIQKRLIQK